MTKHNANDTVLVITNYAVGDLTFDSDVGSWNVSRALADCRAGRHGLYTFDVEETLENNTAIDVDPDKIAALVADKTALTKTEPLIFCQENELIWLIDGHHRLRAMAQLKFNAFPAYVIEEKDNKPYLMYFNGERVSPWMRKRKDEK